MKTDARVRYTKMQIKGAFFQLLSQKPFLQISVTEICNLAEINRTTFYKHYYDMNNLLLKTEEDILDTVRNQWKKLHPQCTIESMESILAELISSKTDYIFHIFKADPEFSFKISEIICTDSFNNFMDTSEYTILERKMIHRFLVYGCSSLIRNWITSDPNSRISPYEFAKFLQHMIEKNTN